MKKHKLLKIVNDSLMFGEQLKLNTNITIKAKKPMPVMFVPTKTIKWDKKEIIKEIDQETNSEGV